MNDILSPERLEAMQLVRDSQDYEGDAQHASDGSTYVIYKKGVFSVCDNGEEGTTKDISDAVRMIMENLVNAKQND